MIVRLVSSISRLRRLGVGIFEPIARLSLPSIALGSAQLGRVVGAPFPVGQGRSIVLQPIQGFGHQAMGRSGAIGPFDDWFQGDRLL